MIWRLILFFIQWIDAESIHRLSILLLRMVRPALRSSLLSGSTEIKPPPPGNPRKIGALTFASPIGLAAGFDKNAEILEVLPHFGFGFAEVGTVTPRPQGGNPLPRLFRDYQGQRIFNRMGFNNLGAGIIAARVAQARTHLPSSFRIGVNVGKNRDTALEGTARDLIGALEPFEGLVDYAVVNVSSPNTPGLRSLQEPQKLAELLELLQEKVHAWKVPLPILVKLAPEIEKSSLQELILAMEGKGLVQGWVLTNTLAGTYSEASLATPIEGGWSGLPLRSLALRKLEEAREVSQLPIISVGGILEEEDARARIQAGADLLQIYSGWVLKGPYFPKKLARALIGS